MESGKLYQGLVQMILFVIKTLRLVLYLTRYFREYTSLLYSWKSLGSSTFDKHPDEVSKGFLGY